MKTSNFKLICIGIIAVLFLATNTQAQTKTPPVKAGTEKSAANAKTEKKKEKKEKKAKKKAKKQAKKAAKQKAAGALKK